MNALRKILIVTLIFATCISFNLIAAEGEPNNAPPRGAQGRAPGPNHMRWFMNLEDVAAETAAHRKNMQEIMKETPEFIKETIKEEKAKKDEGEKIDRDAVDEKLQEKLTEVGGKLIDEQIRHQKAMISLLEKHREDAINNLKAKMKQHRNQQMNKRRQNRQRQGPRGSAGRRGEDFEGSIF